MADTKLTVEQEIAFLRIQVRALRKTVGSLIAWMAESANSPIRRDEAEHLLNMLDSHDEPS